MSIETKGIVMAAGVGMLVATACNDKVEPDVVPVRQASVTFMTPVNGLGDNSYNDNIAGGVFSFAQRTGVRLGMLQPTDMQDAERMYRQWLENQQSVDSAVLILGASAYGQFAASVPAAITGNGTRVLLIESKSETLPDGISSLYINRYGATWLAGAMSREFDAHIIAASPGFSTVDDAVVGFTDGHAANSEDNLNVTLSYIADDENGFTMPDSTFRMMYDFYSTNFGRTDMIFPLLGESGKGVIRYANYDDLFTSLIVGMDVDQGGLCARIPFSLTVRVGEALERMLNDWQNGKDWEKVEVRGLEDGGAEIVFNETFGKYLNVWDDRYSNPDIFKNYYDRYYGEAIKMERQHESE